MLLVTRYQSRVHCMSSLSHSLTANHTNNDVLVCHGDVPDTKYGGGVNS